jgi:hypothetical protein
MKNAVFWDVAPYGFIRDRRFGVTYCAHLQGGRNNAVGTSNNGQQGGVGM